MPKTFAGVFLLSTLCIAGSAAAQETEAVLTDEEIAGIGVERVLTPQEFKAKVEREIDRFELFNECRSMQLLVEGLPDDTLVVGLAEERIQTLADSRLRSARLFASTFDLLASAWASLYVNVAVTGPAFSYTVAFDKRLYDPVSGEDGTSTTWDVRVFGTHGGDGGYILQALSESMDKFLLEYLRVNEEACE